MSFFKLMIFIFCLQVFSAFSNTTICEPSTSSGNNFNKWSEIHVPFELKSSSLSMTLGANIPDWTTIYTVYTNVGVQASTCDKGNGTTFFTILSQEQPISQVGKDYIYSTDVPGIGISITSASPDVGVQTYPSLVNHANDAVGEGFWANVTYWKIPGQIPMNAGSLTVTGPEAAVVLKAGGWTMSSSHPERILNGGDAYISSSRILTLTMLFQPGTCNIEGDNVKVNMGDYDGAGGHSNWKDASFKLTCPDSLGYNGSTSSYGSTHDSYDFPYSTPTDSLVSSNYKKNGRVQISIVPYTDIIDANKGIIALDGTGAQGYGIQLAWGSYNNQNDIEPANPVILNSYTDAHSLNSAFLAGDTPIGGNGFSGGDNTIKMSARYIRTTGETAPGPANAVVQVIANYQ